MRSNKLAKLVHNYGKYIYNSRIECKKIVIAPKYQDERNGNQMDDNGGNRKARAKIAAAVAIVSAVASFTGNVYNIFCYFTGVGMIVLAAVIANLSLVVAIIAFIVLLKRYKAADGHQVNIR